MNWVVYNPEIDRPPELLLGMKAGHVTTWIHQWLPDTSDGHALFTSAGGQFSVVVEISPNTYTATTFVVTFSKLSP